MCDENKPTNLFQPKHEYIYNVVPKIPPHTIDDIISSKVETIPSYIPDTIITHLRTKPDINITKTKEAFGRPSVRMLWREVLDHDYQVQYRALERLSYVVHDPEKCFEAIHMNTMSRLQSLCQSKDDFVRERCVMIFLSLVQMDEGRESFITNEEALENLQLWLRDKCFFVMLKASELLNMLASNFFTLEILFMEGFISTILEQLPTCNTATCQVHLDTLKIFLEADYTEEALEMGVMKVLMIQLIKEDIDNEIHPKAYKCLAILLQSKTAKEKSIGIQFITDIGHTLFEEEPDLQTDAAACLMFLTQMTNGKRMAFAMGLHFRLLELAYAFRNQQLQINCIKALTNIAEVPEGRLALLQRREIIENIPTIKDQSESVDRHIQTLLTVVDFKP